MKFKGIYTALVTPFKDGKVDEASFVRLLKHQLDGGIHGLVLIGTTAESPSLTLEEKKRLFEIAKTEVGAQVPLIVGTGSNSTAQTIESSREAISWGADGLLVVVPYYNKPPQRGLVKHFSAVAEAAGETPVLLYNVPARTVTSLSIDTILSLSETDNIVGIKEATGDLGFASAIAQRKPKDFLLSSGDDGTYFYFLEAGGNGLISVVSNLLPKETVEVFELHESGKIEEASAAFSELMKTISAISFDTNPIPIKAALKLKGIISSDELRLPLSGLEAEPMNRLAEELNSLGVI